MAFSKNAFKIFVLILSVVYSSEVQAQFPVKTEVAYGKLLLRIEVSKNTDDSYLLKLSSVNPDSFHLSKEPVDGYITEWNKRTYSPALQNLMSQLWIDTTITYKQSLLHSNLDTLLTKSFDRLEQKRFNASVESLGQLNYGLSEEELFDLSRYHRSLQIVQDTIKYLRKLGKLTRDKSVKNENLTANHKAAIDKNMQSVLQENAGDGRPLFSQNITIDSLKIVRNILKTYINRVNSKRKYIVNLIGNANVVSSFRNVEASDVNAGFGILAVKPGFAEFVGVITVAQTSDEVNSANMNDFGQSILVPGVRRFSLLTNYRTYSLFRKSPSILARKIGGGIDLNITPYRWGNNGDTISVIPFSLNVLTPLTWAFNTEPGKDYAISTELGLTARYIGGNTTNDELEKFIGVNKRLFIGTIVGLKIKYNALRAQFHAPLFFPKERVHGLSHGQVYASIGIIGSLINDITGVIKTKTEDVAKVISY